MAITVYDDSVDAGRRAPSTTIAMSDASNNNNENDEQKRRRAGCNSPLPRLEDFLVIQILTEHDSEIIMAKRNASCVNSNCHSNTTAATRTSSNGKTQDEEDKEWAASSASDDVVAKSNAGNGSNNSRHENLHNEQEYNNHDNNNNNSNEFLCSICLAEMKPGDKVVVATRQCQHLFHAACMSAWLFSAAAATAASNHQQS
jgi:RING-like zinc finger